jgi:cell division protease FtsH
VTKVTIVPRGQAVGVTQSIPLDDRYNYSKEELQAKIQMALGGRAAEAVALGTITTGAENDLQKVTEIARQMVMAWGMSEKVGKVTYSEARSPFRGLEGADFSTKGYSEETARVIDEEVHALVAEAYCQVESRLRAHRSTLDRIAEELRRHELLDTKQLQEILAEMGIALKQSALAGEAEQPSAAPPVDGASDTRVVE